MEDLIVQRRVIRVAPKNQWQFVSLTDMAKVKSIDTSTVINNWLNTKRTINFLGAWEGEHNPLAFNPVESNRIKTKIGTARGRVSVGKWVKATGAIGIETIAGRYGGTFAVLEIATEFASWLAPEFKVAFNAEVADWAEWDKRLEFVRLSYEHSD